jgi:hypothetical protein
MVLTCDRLLPAITPMSRRTRSSPKLQYSSSDQSIMQRRLIVPFRKLFLLGEIGGGSCQLDRWDTHWCMLGLLTFLTKNNCLAFSHPDGQDMCPYFI